MITAQPYPILSSGPVNERFQGTTEAAPEGPLVRRQISAAPQVRGGESDQRRSTRRIKRELRAFLERMSTIPRVRQCSTKPHGSGVTLVVKAGVAHFGGLQTCGSPWCCPICSAKIAASHCEEVTLALGVHQSLGGGLSLLTCTVRHHRGQSLVGLMATQQEAWRGVVASRAWRRIKRAHGVEWVRVREVTWGSDSGWHPHFHLAFLTTKPLSDQERESIEAELVEEWLRQLRNRGCDGSAERALRLDRWDEGGQLAEYVTKQGLPSEAVAAARARGLALEVTGGGLKRGKWKNLTPWDLLALASGGDADAFRVWCEYEAATLRKRTIMWSNGLRARLLGQVEELTDEERAAEAVGGDVLAWLSGPAWRVMRKLSPGAVQLLEAAEDGSWWSYLSEHAVRGTWSVGAQREAVV